MDCIFCKIVKGVIPATKVFEDDEILIIKDIAPQAPIHLLLMLKSHFSELTEMSESDSLALGRALKKLGGMKNDLGLQDGYRLIVNQGENACQTVKHLHIHILAGEKLTERMV